MVFYYGLRMLGITLAFIGWICAIVTCGLPKWKVTTVVGSNTVTSQTIWEGVWLSCVEDSTGQMQCTPYDMILDLTGDLQAARALTATSIAAGVVAICISMIGWKCTTINIVDKEVGKDKMCVASGVMFIVAGIVCLIPVSWSSHCIIRDFYNPLVVGAQKRDMGEALYIGWAASALMVIGGGMLCCNRIDKSVPQQRNIALVERQESV